MARSNDILGNTKHTHTYINSVWHQETCPTYMAYIQMQVLQGFLFNYLGNALVTIMTCILSFHYIELHVATFHAQMRKRAFVCVRVYACIANNTLHHITLHYIAYQLWWYLAIRTFQEGPPMHRKVHPCTHTNTLNSTYAHTPMHEYMYCIQNTNWDKLTYIHTLIDRLDMIRYD